MIGSITQGSEGKNLFVCLNCIILSISQPTSTPHHDKMRQTVVKRRAREKKRNAGYD